MAALVNEEGYMRSVLNRDLSRSIVAHGIEAHIEIDRTNLEAVARGGYGRK
jgi:hypothetical protein